MPVHLKICGLSSEETLDAAVTSGAHYVGLVHFARSPRHIEAARAAALADHVRGRAAIVLLTVDMPEEQLAELADIVRPDVLQLHGSETTDQVRRIRARLARPVWKAVPIASVDDLAEAAPFRVVADRLVYDAKPPRDAERPGGNGRAFDWRLLGGEAAGDDYVLSGGLTPETLGAALALLSPAVVDVSSGVESAPGVKDPLRIAAFAAALRAAAATAVRRAS
jgi:phosphoribosylanthranilate isomerase